jgi:uncharacterized protein DUF6209
LPIATSQILAIVDETRGTGGARGRRMVRPTILLASLLVTACTDAPATPTGPHAGGKADGELTTLTFSADWQETADGALVAGDTIRVAYDLARVTDCRGETNGSEAWGVTGFASFDGGAPTSFAVSRIADGRVVPVTAELALPAGAHAVAMWFQATNVWGCSAYDSNENANYTFQLEQRAHTEVLGFAADFTQSQSGDIHPGDQVIVHYEPARLAQCQGSTGGHAAWGITGHWQVDGGTVHDISVTRTDGSDLVASDPQLTVPRGHDLALWFEATNVWGCHAVDSDFGANYHAEIH